MRKSWREKLTEIGGYENELLGIPAGSVREIIEELEECHTENTRLSKRIVSLEQDVREANEILDSMEEGS